MNIQLGRLAASFVVLGTSFALAFQQHNLVSDGFVPADHTDLNLVNPWGLALSPTGPFWIANNGTATSTVYDAEGNPFPSSEPLIVTIPPDGSKPTGLVFNGGNGFTIPETGFTVPSRFIFATESGTILGWNAQANASSAITMVDNSGSNAVYKGLAIAQSKGGTFIYATNFASGYVETYDSHWRQTARFTDPNMEAGYAPFGIQAIGPFLFVTYAKRGIDGDDEPGPGNGFVDMFLTNGRLVRRFASHGVLNSPWGIARAPFSFAPYGGAILIGNFGNGRINVFNFGGHFLGALTDDLQIIEIEGLWALSFGNGGLGGDRDDLYFTAGPGDEDHGVFGEIER